MRSSGHRSARGDERDNDDYGNPDRNGKRRREPSYPQRSEVCPISPLHYDGIKLKNQDGSRPPSSRAAVAPIEKPIEPTAAEKAEMEKRAAKVAAWKEKMLAKKAAETAPASAAASPSTSQAQAEAGQTSPAPAPVAAPDLAGISTKPRAKFDPKEIKKRIIEKAAKLKGDNATLGVDASVTAATSGLIPANSSLKPGPRPVMAIGDAKMTGFGLNKTASEKVSEKSSAAKASATLDDDEDVQRKFKKLPDLPQILGGKDNAAGEYDEADDQEDNEHDLRSDEEEAEAARAAAQKRAEDAQTAQQKDIEMANADDLAANAVDPSLTDGAEMEVDEEEIDPLDAFMSNLDQKIEVEPPAKHHGKRANREKQLFDDDDGPALEAVGEDPEDLLNNPKHKRKEIPDIDHAKMEYEPIRKSFYTQSIEIAEMEDEDVDKLRAELDNITVRGVEPPRPITKWSQCGFGAQILDVIRDQKFENPTAIQSQALPALMSGRDTIGIAKTGSGKTLAFILPMFRHIKDQRPVANLEGAIGMIMAPTRELAVQIHRECKPYLKALGLRGVCAYGGAPIKDQIAELKRGAEVIVCTPGRMIDLLAANAGRVTNLRRVSYVVLDEADRMFDMGFEPQINKILGNVRPDRQTVLFSATFPKKMESLARKALTKPIEILVGGRSVVAAEITQVIEVRTEDTKFHRVLELMGELYENDEDARSLIFVDRQESADNLLKELGIKGYPSVSVHGGREQIDRDQAIVDFKNGSIPIMVATSVAARGLDVKQLKLVINYDCPNHGEDYVHRAGRTGRAGNTGTAITFVTPEQEKYAGFLIRALEDSKQAVPGILTDMAASHKKKVAAGEASKTGSGFGGHGVEKFDAARAQERAHIKSQYKIEGEPEEDEEKKEKEKKEGNVEQLIAKASGIVKSSDAPAEQFEPAPVAVPGGIREDLAAHLDRAMQVQKAEVAAAPAPGVSNAAARAAAAAAAINSRIGAKGKHPPYVHLSYKLANTQAGATRPGAPADNRGPDAGAFHATLEINDFPQKARWATTNRTNVAKILEATGTSITTKGNYVAPGVKVAEGESKLYILVEGDTEVAVASAMRELTSHLREGTLLAQETEARGGVGGAGRYRVV